MGIINKKIEVLLHGINIKYYEDLGYEIPRYYDEKHKKYFIKNNTKIEVKTKDLPKGSQIKVLIECDSCGKKYEKSYQEYFKYNHNGKTYCNKCGKKILNSGENNGWYNPNLTQEEREIGRATPENYEWVKKCLARANYKSELSNIHTKDLQVHHLNDWANHKNQRYDVKNGIVLTKEEHMNFHLWQRINYPKQPCTKEQFEEWSKTNICMDEFEGDIQVSRQIYCLEEDKIYNSVFDLQKEWNLKTHSNIYGCCNHRSGTKTINKKHLFWYDEYINMSKNDIENYLLKSKSLSKNSVICLTTGKIFESIVEASNYYNIQRQGISKCCRKEQKSAGKLNDGTKLEWAYYEEFIK